jgi:hypothetical protein
MSCLLLPWQFGHKNGDFAFAPQLQKRVFSHANPGEIARCSGRQSADFEALGILIRAPGFFYSADFAQSPHQVIGRGKYTQRSSSPSGPTHKEETDLEIEQFIPLTG